MIKPTKNNPYVNEPQFSTVNINEHASAWPVECRPRIGRSWFFNVARGWAPSSKEQSELLEAGFQRFHAGQKEAVVLDQWRVDLEQMSLE